MYARVKIEVFGTDDSGKEASRTLEVSEGINLLILDMLYIYSRSNKTGERFNIDGRRPSKYSSVRAEERSGQAQIDMAEISDSVITLSLRELALTLARQNEID